MAEKRGLRSHILPTYINGYQAKNRSFYPFKVEWRFGVILELNFVILILVNARLRLVDKTPEAFQKIIWMMSGHHLDYYRNHPNDVGTSSRCFRTILRESLSFRPKWRNVPPKIEKNSTKCKKYASAEKAVFFTKCQKKAVFGDYLYFQNVGITLSSSLIIPLIPRRL
ncbi:MAG: hypothetical protein LBQ78_05525 [Tannerellaceae bacterium]|jgi:tRNA splicing ligase|nr:hypothetical protein [Tannerellaceae bacterium]